MTEIRQLYENWHLRYVENGLKHLYGGRMDNPGQARTVLKLRKEMLDHWAYEHQQELLPEIAAFNNAALEVLRHLYDKAHATYRQMSLILPDAELSAKCFLSIKYPLRHPYQAEDREDIWAALCEPAWNPVYKNGICPFGLNLPQDMDETFEHLAGTDDTSAWGGFINMEYRQDLHLNSAFYNLIEDTFFALTDFIFVREFNIEINICFEENVLTTTTN